MLTGVPVVRDGIISNSRDRTRGTLMKELNKSILHKEDTRTLYVDYINTYYYYCELEGSRGRDNDDNCLFRAFKTHIHSIITSCCMENMVRDEY